MDGVVAPRIGAAAGDCVICGLGKGATRRAHAVTLLNGRRGASLPLTPPLLVIAALDLAIHTDVPAAWTQRLKPGGDVFMSDSPVRFDPKTIPAEIDRWNWGAFLLNWIWGVGNNTYIALLTLIPFFGLIMLFVLGAKGSAWAWRNGRWDSVEHFKRAQRKWAIWGLVIWIAVPVLFAGMFGGIFY
jgi:hypothetical protein